MYALQIILYNQENRRWSKDCCIVLYESGELQYEAQAETANLITIVNESMKLKLNYKKYKELQQNNCPINVS